MRKEGTRCGRKWVFTTPQFHQSKEVLWGVWSIRKRGLTGTRVWWSHCKSTRTRISKVRNGSVKALKADGKSTCDRLELKQSSRYHMSPGAARKPWCVKKKETIETGAKRGKDLNGTSSDKKDKISEERHAGSRLVWKVQKQAGLKFKLPGPGGSAATRGSRGWPSGAQGQVRIERLKGIEKNNLL